MSLKSLKATKKRKTRKHGFEDNKKEAGKHSKRGQSQFSTLVVYPLYKKKLKPELLSLMTLPRTPLKSSTLVER